ncbi:MAG: xylulose 5-phosphate 3-epimerase [Chloroflexota bacterium]|nr:L-ribulose-5-phosphate 3-epimerase [Anaerolineales bacterium]RLD01981.1 MAG: xylulose 5-phosphate 3-epimerase [Chloroflexota bacterium]
MNKIWTSNLETIKVGLYEKALPKNLSWEERLNITRKTGFDFLEVSVDDTDERLARLDWSPAQRKTVMGLVEKTGVKIQSLSLSGHRRYPLGSKSVETRTRALDIFKRSIELAVDLNARTILLGGAEDYYEEIDQSTKDRFLENLGKGFEWASGAGVMLALENWDIQINTMPRVMEYVDYFDSPWFQTYTDLGNLIYAGVDVVSQLDYVKGHIAALHVKDTLPGQLRYVSPGEGAVPFVEAFEKLAETGFQSPVVLELWTEDFPDAVEIVKKAGDYIREKMKEGWARYQRKIERGA